MHRDKNLESMDKCEELFWARGTVGGCFHVFISFVVSNIVLITNKIDEMVKITFEKLNT